MIQFTTQNGKTYQLKIKDGEHFYRWYGDGQLHPLLAGSFTGTHEGELAMKRYLREVDSKKSVKKVATPREELEELTGKAELLGFASGQGIAVPDNFKIPSQIKKYLLNKVGE